MIGPIIPRLRRACGHRSRVCGGPALLATCPASAEDFESVWALAPPPPSVTSLSFPPLLLPARKRIT